MLMQNLGVKNKKYCGIFRSGLLSTDLRFVFQDIQVQYVALIVHDIVESRLKLVKLFAQHGSTFPLFRGHPFVAQQSRVHLHSNAQHVEPTHALCPAYPFEV